MEKALQTLREHIDTIDNEIFDTIQKRLTLMKKMGEEKKKLQKPIIDDEREKEILEYLEEKAKKTNTPFVYIKNIWENLFEMSKELQK